MFMVQVDTDLQQSNETAKTLHKDLEEKFSRMEEMSSKTKRFFIANFVLVFEG